MNTTITTKSVNATAITIGTIVEVPGRPDVFTEVITRPMLIKGGEKILIVETDKGLLYLGYNDKVNVKV